MATMRLGHRQQAALRWLRDAGAWRAAWWGGRPHVGWPKEMSGATFDALYAKRLVAMTQGQRFDKVVSITGEGRKALEECI